MNDYRMDIIDTYIRRRAKQFGRSYEEAKLGYQFAYELGILDIRAVAEHAGVTEDAVRRYFGDEAASEPEETDEPDTVDEHVSQLEKDADNLLDSADRDYNNASLEPNAYRTHQGLLDQLNAINHQLNILTHIIAAGVKG